MENKNKTFTQRISKAEELRRKLTQLKFLNTRCHEMQKVLINASQDWRMTFDAVQDIIILTDKNLKIIKTNLAAAKFSKIGIKELVGKKCCELFHGTDHSPESCPLRLAQETKARVETDLYLADKSMHMAVSVDPILDAKGNAIRLVHIIRNITDQKQKEDDLRHEKEESETLVKIMSDRELKVAELKNEVNSLLKELSRPKKYN